MAVKVIDKASQKVVEVTAEQAQDLAMRGEVLLVDERVRVASGNRTGTVAREDLAAALGQGARLVDDAEAQRLTIEREESGFAGNLQGGAEALAAGASLGLSTAALEAMGADPARMAARRKGLGAAGTGLEIAGAVAPALLTGGGSAAASGASAAGRVGLAARIARATPAGALERVAARAGEGLASRGSSRIVSGGGRLFVEGAGGGVGTEIDEAVLGDRELAADQLAMAGLMGGALGVGAGGALTGLAKVTIGATKAPIKGMQKVLGRGNAASGGEATTEIAEAAVADSGQFNFMQRAMLKNSIAQGNDPEVARRVVEMTRTPEGREDILRLERDRPRIEREAAELLTEKVPAVHEGMRQARRLANGESKAKFWDALGPRTPEQQVAAIGEVEQQVSRHRAAIETMREQNGLYGGAIYEPALIKRASDALVRFEKQMFDTPVSNGRARSTHAAMAADQYKRELGEIIDEAGGWGRAAHVAPPVAAANKLLRERYSEVQKLLMNEEIFGGAAKAQARHNAAFVRMSDADAAYRDVTSGTGLGAVVNPDGSFNAFKAIKLVRAHGRTGGDVAVARLMDAMDARVAYFDEISKTVDVDDVGRAAITQVKSDVEVLRAEFSRQAIDAAKLDDLIEWRRTEGLNSPSLLTTGTSLAGMAGYAIGGPVGAVIGWGAMAARQPYTTLHRYAAVMQVLDGSDKRIGGLVDKIVETATRAGKASARYANKPSPSFGKLGAVGARAAGTAAHTERTKKRETAITKSVEMLTDPGAIERALLVQMHSLYDVAPGVAAVVQARVAVAAKFLTSKMPKTYTRGTTKMVDPVSAASYDRYLEAVIDPFAALERFEYGRMTPEAGEAIRVVYPALWSDLQARVADGLAERAAAGNEVDYNGRMQLGQLFGAPFDPSLKPGVGAALQSAASVAPAPPPGSPPPTKPKPGKMTAPEPATMVTAADRAADWKALS
jgi:hypothetical protein